MDERSSSDALQQPKPDGKGAADDVRVPDEAPGRSGYIIAFGAVALVAMIFGFLLGLLF